MLLSSRALRAGGNGTLEVTGQPEFMPFGKAYQVPQKHGYGSEVMVWVLGFRA